METLSILFLLTTAVLSSALFQEKETYVYHENVDKHYKFFCDAKKWNDARLTCQKDNATLAMPMNQDELDIMIAKFQWYKTVRSSQMQDLFFMGCHSLFERGTFITLKEQKPLPRFLKWQPGEPNGPKIGQHEDCCSMKFDGLMYDAPCFYRTTFFCEKPGKAKKENCDCEDEKLDIDPRFPQNN